MATSVTGQIAGNLLGAHYDPGLTFGSQKVSSPADLPNQLQIPFTNGTGVGQLTLMAFTSGTLTNVTPGTTDTISIDITALKDPGGNTINPTKINAILIYNDSTVDGTPLLVGNGTTPFDDFLNAVTGGLLKVLNGHIDPTDSQARPGGALLWGFNVTGYTAGSSHKILKLFSGTAVSLPYRLALFGRP